MTDLDKALADITAIRSQMARGTEFLGYGPATAAVTAVFALAAAVAQALWLEHPLIDIALYLGLWVATAALSALVIALEAITRSRRLHSGLAQEMILAAAEQFLPALVAGALLTAVLLRFVPQASFMLPGLWQIVFSLGVFASCRFLPPATFVVGVWYLVAGLACIAFAQGEHALSPWAMGIPFCGGQVLVAGVLLASYRGGNGQS